MALPQYPQPILPVPTCMMLKSPEKGSMVKGGETGESGQCRDWRPSGVVRLGRGCGPL